jgi:hypothetical protein
MEPKELEIYITEYKAVMMPVYETYLGYEYINTLSITNTISTGILIISFIASIL